MGIETIVLLAATAASAYGSMQAGAAKAQQAKNAQAAAEYNATVAGQKATSALNIAAQNAAQSQRESDVKLAKQRGALLQAGIGADGSAADVLGQSAQNLEMNALNIRFAGEQQATDLKNQQQLDVMQGNAYGEQADDAQTAGYIGAATSILGGASGYYNNQTKLKLAKAQGLSIE